MVSTMLLRRSRERVRPEPTGGPDAQATAHHAAPRSDARPDITAIGPSLSDTLNVAPSAQYAATNAEGHEHPTPAFGAPTLVWHLAMSPHWSEARPDFTRPLQDVHDELARTYEETRTAFFQEMNTLLTTLQSVAGYPAGPPQVFDPQTVPAAWRGRRRGVGEPFYTSSPGCVRFTLWWTDEGTRPSPEPTPDALRVRVHAGAHRDYVTLSFYIDAAKPWDAPPQVAGSDVAGVRRADILAKAERVRAICDGRMVADADGASAVDRDLLPEHGASPEEAADLLAASRYLYAGVWEEFSSAMGLDRLPRGKLGRVFANFRGLVLASDGLPETVEPRAFAGSAGADPFPRFKGNGGLGGDGRSGAEPNEANAAVKAYWPFVRRSIGAADRKEFIACGIATWRALYVTALSCPPAFAWAEEGRGPASEIPAGSLPDEEDDAAGSGGKTVQAPVRYLILTKGAPHRRQIGRLVDRINSMSTMRLIALRDYGIVRDASTQIQLRGQELDTMMRKWSAGRAEVRRKFEALKAGKSDEDRRLVQDKEDAAIQELADRVENDLIDLSAALDAVGIEAVHGLHFRINRSRYYVEEFESLLATLRIGTIDTWVSYDQFVTRGLKPAFDFIESVGGRLLGLRTRLQSVLEGIETSALVKQSAATRENTAQLRSIATAFAKLQKWLRVVSVLLAAATLIAGLLGLQGALGEMVGWLRSR